MEQAVSAINWRAVNPPKSGGEYRRWSLQQVARGADAVLHFQWRAAVGGAEKWHSGMLPHAGPRTRSWQGVVELGAELRSLRDVAGARTRADIAIALDWNSWWALEMDSRPSTQLSLISIIREWYQPLWEHGYCIDFVNPENDLSGYPLVLVPQLYLTTDTSGRRIEEAAEAGSTVVIGFFSGAVDADDHVRTGGYPQQWRELLGLWVEEYRPLLPGQSIALDSHDPRIATGRSIGTRWSEHIHLTDAEAVLSYVGGDLDGLAAVTRRRIPGLASGAAFYLSTSLEASVLATLLRQVAASAGARAILDTPPPSGVEVALRETPTESFLFLLNHSDADRSVDITSWRADSQRSNLADREPAASPVSVLAGDVVILVARKERTSDPR
jgi:beta-galactosidase